MDVVRHVTGFRHVVVVPSERRGGRTARWAIPALRELGATVELVPMTRRPLTVANALAVSTIRSVVRSHDAALVHVHSSIAGALGRCATVGVDVPIVYTPNGIGAGRGVRAVEHVLGRRTTSFVAVSPSEAQEAARLRLARRGRIVVIPNGIDAAVPAPMPLRAELGIGPDEPLVGFVGRLVPQKGWDVFLAAWDRLAAADPSVRGVMIGDGPTTAAAEVTEGVERWSGRLVWVRGSDDLEARLHDLTVLCLPSRFEGAPYVPLEAMRAGVAVVLSAVVGNVDTVEHDVSGLLVPPDDPAAVAAAVEVLIRDPERCQRIAAAGRARVRDRFDVTASAADLAALYRRLITP